MIDGLVAKLKDAGKKDTDLGGQLKGSTSCLEKLEKNIYEAQVTDIVEKLSAHSSCTGNYVGHLKVTPADAVTEDKVKEVKTCLEVGAELRGRGEKLLKKVMMSIKIDKTEDIKGPIKKRRSV